MKNILIGFFGQHKKSFSVQMYTIAFIISSAMTASLNTEGLFRVSSFVLIVAASSFFTMVAHRNRKESNMDVKNLLVILKKKYGYDPATDPEKTKDALSKFSAYEMRELASKQGTMLQNYRFVQLSIFLLACSIGLLIYFIQDLK